MNTYSKFTPNVFLAKCQEKHEKGQQILVQTKYGKENECTVFNLVYQKDGFFYYSIVRSDGFNVQEWAKKKAERLENASLKAKQKSDEKWAASNEGADFLALAEPIKIGHHSEKKHRALIERNHSRMNKSMELLKQSEEYASRMEYWKGKEDTINLSMPDSLEFYQLELERATSLHKGLKEGTIERSHSYSLAYAKKEINEISKKLIIAERLWKS